MIGIAVIGCGYWGPQHVRNFAATRRSRVVSVIDEREDRRAYVQERYPTVQVSADLADALAPAVDAVVIATPAGSHYPLARAALLAGKHVLVEKPLTTSAADAEDLTALAATGGRILMVGHTFMYHPTVRALAEIIAAGDLGEVRYVNSTRVNLGLHRKDVDVLWDLAAHDIAILRYLLGGQPVVEGAQGVAVTQPGVAEVAFAQLRYPPNVLASVHVSWLDPVKLRRMTVVGSRRMAVWDDVEPGEKLRIYDRGVEREPYYDDYGQWQVAYRHGEAEVPLIPWQEPLRTQAEHFLDCIADGAAPLTDAAAGLAVVQTLEACSERLRLGGGRGPRPSAPSPNAGSGGGG